MEAINNMIDKFLKPIRTNYCNLLWNESEHLSAFEQINLNVLSHDNFKLSCTLFLLNGYKSAEKTPTIIYSHAYCSSRYECVNLLAHCKRHGLSLCIYDSRSSGESQGDTVTFGYKESIDLFFVLLKLLIDYNVRHFVLWGRSIGCNAVLMLQHKLLSNTSRNLNRKPSGQKAQVEYPPHFNVFILKNYQQYVQRNGGKPLADGLRINFTIVGLVLDVPYYSMNSFIKDNIRRFVPYLPGMFTLVASSYVIERIKDRFGVNLRENQNKFLLKVTNMNTAMIVSDKDEIVPYKRFEKMQKIFAENFQMKNSLKIINCGKEHGVRRDEPTITQIIVHILNNQNKNNVVNYDHIHIMNLNDPRARQLAAQIGGTENVPSLSNQEPLVLEEKTETPTPEEKNFNPMMQTLKAIDPPSSQANVDIDILMPKMPSMRDVIKEKDKCAEQQKIFDFVKNHEGKPDLRRKSFSTANLHFNMPIPIPGLADASAAQEQKNSKSAMTKVASSYFPNSKAVQREEIQGAHQEFPSSIEVKTQTNPSENSVINHSKKSKELVTASESGSSVPKPPAHYLANIHRTSQTPPPMISSEQLENQAKNTLKHTNNVQSVSPSKNVLMFTFGANSNEQDNFFLNQKAEGYNQPPVAKPRATAPDPQTSKLSNPGEESATAKASKPRATEGGLVQQAPTAADAHFSQKIIHMNAQAQ